ncbi:MAG: multicopper oxidase domain-containing protein [Saprospiraceae bacterium]|nr:multicopper oxidase domain-containing protein [Saprospiraceae bacterium]
MVGAVLRVPPEITRLRILNGSPRKMYAIGLSPELNNPTTFVDMWLIATGGGYIPEPLPMDSTLMSVGDRREYLVDFSQFNDGDTLYMSNLSVPSDAVYGSTAGSALMAFIVDDSIFPTDPITVVPAVLDPTYALAPGAVDYERTKKLEGSKGSGGVWTIDGTPMNLQVINDTVLVNTKERWNIINTTDVAHPFHIHKVQFQVVEYSGKAGFSEVDSTYTFPDLPDELLGYKDVQLIRAGATMSFEARFDSFPSPLLATEGYMYHCHILTHEDTSMMHQFVVVDSIDFFSSIKDLPGTEPLIAFPNPATNTISIKGEYSYKGNLRFYDLQGKLLRQHNEIWIGEAQIPVYDLPRGVVIVVFNSRDGHFVGKVSLH